MLKAIKKVGGRQQAIGNSQKAEVFSAALCAMLFAFCVPSHAQQSKRLYRIGYLSPAGPLQASGSQEAFRQGLRQLGYIEGQNIIIEWRSSNGEAGRFPELAAEFVRLKVDCIVSTGIPATRAAKQATGTIPVVMNVGDDPVQRGFVASLARPGGNVTGFTNINSELAGKRLELLKEAFPKVSRVAHLSAGLTGEAHLKEVELVVRALGVQLQPLEVQGPNDLENAFRAAGKGDALIVVATGWINSHRARIVNLAAKTRLPVMYTQAQYVHDGGLMSYSADQVEQARRAAIYVDKILKGAKPANLPVEQPAKFELVINLKTARQIGLAIPPNVLARADKVIR